MDIYTLKPLNKLPFWRKEMGVIGWEGDELFIPACAVGMTDAMAILCLGHDGQRVVMAEGTVLVPETWARKEKSDAQSQAVFDHFRRHALFARANPNGVLGPP